MEKFYKYLFNWSGKQLNRIYGGPHINKLGKPNKKRSKK
jgi:hypothetical protein